METGQQGGEHDRQELYSAVLNDAVAWGSVGTGEEWVNTTADGTERGGCAFSRGVCEPLREADEDVGSEVNLNNQLTEEEREEIQQELTRLEEEISTLRQVLVSKERQMSDLKQRLGVSPLSQWKNNFTRSWQDIQTSDTYKKTSESLTSAGQKTSAAFSTLGTALSRTLGDMRNSPTFQSFEQQVENTVSNIKSKMVPTSSSGSFEDVLASAANASSQDTPTNNLMDNSERDC